MGRAHRSPANVRQRRLRTRRQDGMTLLVTSSGRVGRVVILPDAFKGGFSLKTTAWKAWEDEATPPAVRKPQARARGIWLPRQPAPRDYRSRHAYSHRLRSGLLEGTTAMPSGSPKRERGEYGPHPIESFVLAGPLLAIPHIDRHILETSLIEEKSAASTFGPPPPRLRHAPPLLVRIEGTGPPRLEFAHRGARGRINCGQDNMHVLSAALTRM